MFVDRTHLKVSGGCGGNGCMSFRREKYVERGGPDGGNGGPGGSVYIEADFHKATLHDFVYRPLFKAKDGAHGESSLCTGATGEDIVLKVPLGTLVYREGALLADLNKPGQRILVARGGRGGRGNASFKTSYNTAPRLSEKGEPGEACELDLELKLLADVGVVGFPNAGKSTLLARLTKAHPKIAAYPFTTLTPNLGVAHWQDRSFVLADIPGLIEGAHEGRGLGDEFLRHIERTRVLVHLVDVNGSDGKTPLQTFRALHRELKAYSPALLKKPMIVAVTKADLGDAEASLKKLKRSLGKTPAFIISAVSGVGIDRLLAAVVKTLDQAPETPTFVPDISHLNLKPTFTVQRQEGRFVVTGSAVESWVARTPFEQDEAVARLQKILRGLGVDEALEREGIRPGQTVCVGDHEFVYRPDPNRKKSRR